ncbi:MAG: hypothetical protein EBR82_10125 [Caulobacteraceae bacterium]|nr:hypothetical protein [Caulobacteraceae bacterium]
MKKAQLDNLIKTGWVAVEVNPYGEQLWVDPVTSLKKTTKAAIITQRLRAEDQELPANPIKRCISCNKTHRSKR